MINNCSHNEGITALSVTGNNAKSTTYKWKRTGKNPNKQNLSKNSVINKFCLCISWPIKIGGNIKCNCHWESWRIDIRSANNKNCVQWEMHLKFWIFEFGFNTRMNGWWVYVLLSTSNTNFFFCWFAFYCVSSNLKIGLMPACVCVCVCEWNRLVSIQWWSTEIQFHIYTNFNLLAKIIGHNEYVHEIYFLHSKSFFFFFHNCVSSLRHRQSASMHLCFGFLQLAALNISIENHYVCIRLKFEIISVF